MKQILFLICLWMPQWILHAQSYPDPEFRNEVCLLKKDSVYTTFRLEKTVSKMDTKVRAAGFGGMENGYTFDGEKSPVRLDGGRDLAFIYVTGAAANTSSLPDSPKQAPVANPSATQGMGDYSDPSNTITLYKTNPVKGVRKIYLQKSGGVFNGKIRSSDKYSFSIKMIREGYWLLLVDKDLPKGEYAFTVMDFMNTGGVYDVLLFAFGVD